MSYKLLIILVLLVFQCFSLLAQAGPLASEFAAYELRLQVVSLSKSRWKASEIQKNISETAKILSQCGVKIASVQVLQEATFNPELMFDLEGYSSEEDTLEPNGALSLAGKYPAKFGELRVFLFDQFDPSYASITATSMPKVRITQKDQQPALNSVWLAYESERQLGFAVEDGGYQPDYNIMAHELGHLLLDDSHFSDSFNYNLMHESASMLNSRLTLKQCKIITKSQFIKLAKPKLDLRKEECVSQSAVAGKILFMDDQPKECEKAHQLINNLELFQDRISDLAKAQNLNFYFQKAGNTIHHLDRGAFEASLISTYDDYGKVLLSDKSISRLWKHEMGHAILNAQLINDWPWYATRMKMYKNWEQYILESTMLENDINRLRANGKDTTVIEKQLKILSDKSNNEFSKINNLKNGFEIENLLSSYHEVFSDAVVIIDEMNPKAIRDALLNPEDPQMLQATAEEKEDLLNRDYSFLRSTDSWIEQEAHAKLTPSLAFYWKLLAGKKLTDSQKKYFVRQFYEAIKLEVLDLVKNNKFDINPAEANNRLIKRIQKIYIPDF